MSVHSYSRCWIHLIWGTLNRDRVLNKKAATGLSQYLVEYADEQAVYMKINFVNLDHVHALIDLPTGFSVEKLGATLEGKFFPLDKFKRRDYGKICLGQRVWRFLRVAFKC
jgi:REP element-mobilizing transposase RayT